MSADNWRICPQCWNRYTKDLDRRASEAAVAAEAAYGSALPDEYLELRQEAERLREERLTPRLEETLREDYEIWPPGEVGSPEIRVDYSCSCKECGLSFKFKHTEQIPLSPPVVREKEKPR